MSTTLRTLICSCRYSREGDPGLALGLTIHVCQCHTQDVALPMWKPRRCAGYLGGRRAGRRGAAERTAEDRKAGEELLRVSFMINALEPPRTEIGDPLSQTGHLFLVGARGWGAKVNLRTGR